MKKNLIIILLIIITCILTLIFFNFFKTDKKKTDYITRSLERCTIVQIVEASGEINPVKTVNIGSQVSGLITDIFVDYNSEVKKGQVLAMIDTSVLKEQVVNAKAGIDSANADLDKAEATMENDRVNYERYKNLYARNFVSKSEYDNAYYAYKVDLAQVKAAKAKLAQAKVNYNTALTNLGYAKIVSPVDGVVISKKVDVGQTVAASYQTPELFTVAQDLKKMQIEASVSEADMNKVKEGQEVNYTLDGYQDDVFKGRVKQVRLDSTTTSNVVTYTVVISVDNEDLKLKPGMTANVSILVNSANNVLCVPNSALKVAIGENTRYETRGVWVLKGKKPQRIDITTGASNETKTEVQSDSLKEGDLIITGINGAEKPNMRKGPMGF